MELIILDGVTENQLVVFQKGFNYALTSKARPNVEQNENAKKRIEGEIIKMFRKLRMISEEKVIT